eukprot:gene1404-1773_t
MGKHAQLVMGPAGSGKSTYCDTMRKYCEEIKRVVHVVNLDPAAEVFNYPVSIVTVDEVMDELAYGPNGGLVYAMEYLVENMDWLTDELGDYEDDYIIIDCPGQIELYSHIPVMRVLVDTLQQLGYRVCAVFLVDSQFILDSCKFISGALMCLSAMVRLEIPHINVLTKVDVLKNSTQYRELEKFLDLEVQNLVDELNLETNNRYHKLNRAIGSLLEDYSLVGFLPLDISDQESLNVLLQHIDNSIQYGEDLEPQEPKNDFKEEGDDEDDDDGGINNDYLSVVAQLVEQHSTCVSLESYSRLTNELSESHSFSTQLEDRIEEMNEKTKYDQFRLEKAFSLVFKLEKDLEIKDKIIDHQQSTIDHLKDEIDDNNFNLDRYKEEIERLKEENSKINSEFEIVNNSYWDDIHKLNERVDKLLVEKYKKQQEEQHQQQLEINNNNNNNNSENLKIKQLEIENQLLKDELEQWNSTFNKNYFLNTFFNQVPNSTPTKISKIIDLQQLNNNSNNNTPISLKEMIYQYLLELNRERKDLHQLIGFQSEIIDLICKITKPSLDIIKSLNSKDLKIMKHGLNQLKKSYLNQNYQPRHSYPQQQQQYQQQRNKLNNLYSL